MEGPEFVNPSVSEEPLTVDRNESSPSPEQVELSAPQDITERLDVINDQKKSSIFIRGEKVPYLIEHLYGKDGKLPDSNQVFCSDPICDDYIKFVSRTGRPLFDWQVLKTLLLCKLEWMMLEMTQAVPFDHLPKVPNTDRSSSREYIERILSASQSLTGVPFTIQRICELLSDPRKHYKRADRFFRALEKNINVITTVDEEGRRETERQPIDVIAENGLSDDLNNGIRTDIHDEPICNHSTP